MAELAFTGERFLPECEGEIWLEHWHRYHFATALARGRRVLDVASGEGYGSALLASVAREVVGVDAAAEAVEHAARAYGGTRHLRFVAADCTRLPFPDAAFDLVVSFETIEHITAQREFLAEVRRVLAPEGVLLLSSPNKAEYSDARAYSNPFHVAELYRDELATLLANFFPHTAWYGQSLGFGSTIVSEGPALPAAGELVDAAALAAVQDKAAGTVPRKEPLYYLVACALTPGPLAGLEQGFSVLGDPADTVYRDYRDTYRKFVAASEAVTAFREREARHERDLAAAHAASQVSLDAAQVSLEMTLQRLATVESERDAAATLATRTGQRLEKLEAAHARLAAERAEIGARHAKLEADHDALRVAQQALQGDRDAAAADLAAVRAEAARLQGRIGELQGLAATLGGTLHAAQQSALRLTGALHEANARYQAALDAAHAATAAQVAAGDAALHQLREAQQQEIARQEAAAAALRETIAHQAQELARRSTWRWRLRPPWRAG